jgi:hypothetical protein
MLPVVLLFGWLKPSVKHKEHEDTKACLDRIFTYARTVYPASAVVYEYMAEAWYRAGAKKEAIAAYTWLIELAETDKAVSEKEKESLLKDASERIALLQKN